VKTFEEVYERHKEDYMELCLFRLAKQASKLLKGEDLKFSVQLTRDYVGFQNGEVTFLAIYSSPKKLILHIRALEGQASLCKYTATRYDQNWKTLNYDFIPGIADLEGLGP